MKMTGAMETSFKLALKKPPSLRTAEVNKTIVSLISIALLMLAKIKLLLQLAVGKVHLSVSGVRLKLVNSKLCVDKLFNWGFSMQPHAN